jgi:hypothetical protein
LLVGAVATGAGCLYIEPINERPRARIEEVSVGPYHIGDQVVVSAAASTDDRANRDLRVPWRAQICATPASCEVVELSSVTSAIGGDIGVTGDRKGELVVTATIIDTQGAEDVIELRVDIVNRAPTIEVQLNGFPDPGDSGGFVLGLPVEIAAEILDLDGDELETAWVAFPPMGSVSTVDVEPVAGAADTFSLAADDAGVWEVEITTDDGDGGVVQHTEPLVFSADGPPCVGSLSPAAGPIPVAVDQPTRFSVLSVFDALDAYPKPINAHPAVGETTFQWKLATPGSGGAFVDLSTPIADVLIDPSLYQPGDRLTLRVEVDDRNGFLPLGCDEGQASCDANDTGNPSPACSQRATWEIEIR